MNSKKLLVIASATLLLTGLAVVAEAQGHARGARLAGSTPVAEAGSAVSVPVSVDLTGVMVAGRPAELGGYLARIEFDPAVVRFVDAAPGAGFDSAVVTTEAEKANTRGVVKMTSVRPGFEGPAGVIHVATARFEILAPGGADTIRVTIDSLSSVLIRDEEGRLVKDLSIPVDSPNREREVRRPATER